MKHPFREYLPFLAIIGALSATATNTAHAQATGQTDVDINFPNIVILNYPSSLTIDFTATDPLEDANDEGSLTPAAVTLASPATIAAGLTPTAGTLNIPNSVAVTVEDVWAVRGLSDDGDITVAATIDTASATNSTSTATISGLEVVDGATSGASIDVPSPGFALSNAVIGDITFDLDISGVTVAGIHTGIQYTITASAP